MRKRKQKEKDKRKKVVKNNEGGDLLQVCKDIIAENENNWKRMRLDNEALERLREEREKEEEERRLRIERAAKKKKDLLEKIEKKNGNKIIIVKNGKGVDWIREKQRMWRQYREKENITDEEEKELRRTLIQKLPERKKKLSEEDIIDVVKENTMSPLTTEHECSGGVVGREVAGLMEIRANPAKVTHIEEWPGSLQGAVPSRVGDMECKWNGEKVDGMAINERGHNVLVRAPKIVSVIVSKTEPENPQGAVPSRIGAKGMELAKKSVEGMAQIVESDVNSEKVRVPKNGGFLDEWLVDGKNGNKSGPNDEIDCDASEEGAVQSELVEYGMYTRSKFEYWSKNGRGESENMAQKKSQNVVPGNGQIGKLICSEIKNGAVPSELDQQGMKNLQKLECLAENGTKMGLESVKNGTFVKKLQRPQSRNALGGWGGG